MVLAGRWAVSCCPQDSAVSHLARTLTGKACVALAHLEERGKVTLKSKRLCGMRPVQFVIMNIVFRRTLRAHVDGKQHVVMWA